MCEDQRCIRNIFIGAEKKIAHSESQAPSVLSVNTMLQHIIQLLKQLRDFTFRGTGTENKNKCNTFRVETTSE